MENPINTRNRELSLEMPALPATLQQLLSVLECSSGNAHKIAEVISADQGLAGKMLKLVNSAFYGFPRQVSSIQQAVVVLGNTTVRNVALSLGMSEVLKAAEDNENIQALWDHSLATAIAGRLVAKKAGAVSPEEAYLAGLMHDIGHMALIINGIEPSPEPSPIWEEESGNEMNHTTLGGMVLEKWRFPGDLCEIAAGHHRSEGISFEKEPLLTATMIADFLVAEIGGSKVDKCCDGQSLTGVLEQAGLPKTSFPEFRERVANDLEEIKSSMFS